MFDDDFGEMGFFDDNGLLSGMGQTAATLELERLRAERRAAELAAEERASERRYDAFGRVIADAARVASTTVPAAIAARRGQVLLPQGQIQEEQGSGAAKVVPWLLGGVAVVGIAWLIFRSRQDA